VFPGVVNATTSYGVKSFTIRPGAAQYVQVNFNDPRAAFFAGAFLDNYTVASGAAGNRFLGDAGGTGNLGGNPGYFQVFVPFGHTLSIAVNEVTTGGGSGRAFTLQVEGFGDTQFSPPFALGPDLTVSVTHPLSFYFGASSDYVIVVTNAGTAPSAETITLSDRLPASMTAFVLNGVGWNGVLSSLTCTTDVALSPGASAPQVTLTAAAPTSGLSALLINSATVSGGGDQVSTNNVSGDVTTILQGRVVRPRGPIVRN
jgi:uncharacterized repeat protein (TIGR01451 family)